MDRRFRKARTDSNWCEIDMLKASRFKDIPKVEVKWPEGLKTHEVVVKYDSERVRDGFSITSIPIEKAYIKVFKKGYPRLLRVTEAPPMRLVGNKP